VRSLGRHDQHLIPAQLHGVVAGCPAAAPIEDDERLRVGMHVQADPFPRRRPYDEDRDPDTGARQPFEERRGRAELHLVEIEHIHTGPNATSP